MLPLSLSASPCFPESITIGTSAVSRAGTQLPADLRSHPHPAGSHRAESGRVRGRPGSRSRTSPVFQLGDRVSVLLERDADEPAARWGCHPSTATQGWRGSRFLDRVAAGSQSAQAFEQCLSRRRGLDPRRASAGELVAPGPDLSQVQKRDSNAPARGQDSDAAAWAARRRSIPAITRSLHDVAAMDHAARSLAGPGGNRMLLHSRGDELGRLPADRRIESAVLRDARSLASALIVGIDRSSTRRSARYTVHLAMLQTCASQCQAELAARVGFEDRIQQETSRPRHGHRTVRPRRPRRERLGWLRPYEVHRWGTTATTSA